MTLESSPATTKNTGDPKPRYYILQDEKTIFVYKQSYCSSHSDFKICAFKINVYGEEEAKKLAQIECMKLNNKFQQNE